ncbi:preprotein translocase subunit SecE [Bulleidia sp. zg-1006]|nr:preprotein translocase subunit SecE [Bulleidia sp. zg-1006]
MTDKRQVKNNVPAKDHWFTFSGIRKEASRVRWPKWKTISSEPGTFQNATEVLVFTLFFSLFFILCDFSIAFLLKTVGIGG